MKTIGSRIRAEREAQAISRPDLARFAGIATSTLSDLELGESKSTTALHKIARRLGLRAEWLETGKGPKMADRVNESASEYPGSQATRPDFDIVADSIKLLQDLMRIRGWAEFADIAHPRMLAIAYEVIESEHQGLTDGNVIDLTTRLAAKLRAEGIEDEIERRKAAGTGPADVRAHGRRAGTAKA